MVTYDDRIAEMRRKMSRFQWIMAITLFCYLAFIFSAVGSVVAIAVYLYRCH